MTSTFLYLTICSMRNRIRLRIRRLREPRYLIGSIVGAAYFYYFVFARTFSSSSSRAGRNMSLMALLSRIAEPVQLIGATALLLLAALMWVWPGTRRPLEFSRAEVQFLFQAPLTRRQLVHYKLLRSQIGLVFSSAVATLILRPSSLARGWTLLVGMWLLFTLGRLYSVGVSLSRESLARNGVSGWAKEWAPVAIVVAVIGVLAVTVGLDWPKLAPLADARSVFDEVQRVVSTGPAALVLAPFRTIVRLPLAASTVEFLTVLPVMLAMIALSYIWVLRSDTAFEEASAAHAEQRASQPSRSRTPTVGSLPTPFRLALEGRPEMAILWKNLIMVGRYASLKTLLRLAPLVVVFGIAAGRGGGQGGVATLAAVLCLTFSGLAVFLGPQAVRNDLRQDLANLAVLKTWPIPGTALIRGEILAPTVLLSVTVWMFLVGAGLLLGSVHMGGSTAGHLMLNRLSYTVAAMIVAPQVILAQLVVQNGAAVLFPAWVAVSASRSRGIDALGQRLLMMAGMVVVLVVSLLPAVVVAGAVALVVYMTTGMILVIVPALIVAGVMLAESALATEWIGRVFDRTDVGAIGPSE